MNISRPVISRSGRISIPELFISTRKYVSPLCFGTVASVRARQMAQSAFLASDVQTFWPVRSQPPSARSALVRSEARSEPASGSLKSWHHEISPRSVGPAKRSAWAALPWPRIAGMAQPPMPMSGRVRPAAAELVVDDQARRGRRTQPVRRRPGGRGVAGVGQREALVRHRAAARRTLPASWRPRARPPVRRRRRWRRRSAGAACPPARASPSACPPAAGAAEQLTQAQRPAQVQVRVVLPGEADAAEDLDAVLGVVRRRRPARTPRQPRRSAAARPGVRRSRGPHPRPVPRRPRPGTACRAHRCLTAWNEPIGAAELLPDRGVLGRGARAPARHRGRLDREQRRGQIAVPRRSMMPARTCSGPPRHRRP